MSVHNFLGWVLNALGFCVGVFQGQYLVSVVICCTAVVMFCTSDIIQKLDER